MKLTELLLEYDNTPNLRTVKTKFTNNEIVHLKSSIEDRLRDHGYNRLGEGGFATVWAHPVHDDHVIKVHHSGNDLQDGYLNYIQQKEVRSKSNPHFPIIHSIKHYIPQQGMSSVSIIKMEKLHKEDDLNDKERQKVKEEGGFSNYTQPHEAMGNILHQKRNTIMPGAVSRMNRRETENPHLLNAMRLINKVKKETGAYGDFARRNVMYRRTPHGVQAVITDPLA